MRKQTVILIAAAAALSACATAPSPFESDNAGAAWFRVGETSADQQIAISNDANFPEESASRRPASQLYWFLGGR